MSQGTQKNKSLQKNYVTQGSVGSSPQRDTHRDKIATDVLIAYTDEVNKLHCLLEELKGRLIPISREEEDLNKGLGNVEIWYPVYFEDIRLQTHRLRDAVDTVSDILERLEI